MSQVFAPLDASDAEAIRQEFYVPITGPVVGILVGMPVTFTNYSAAQNLPEINAYADGSRGFVGVTDVNTARLGTGFVQVAGESVLMLAARSTSALTTANCGDPLYVTALATVDLTRVADTDPLMGVISYVDAATGDFKVIIEQDKPPSGGAGFTDWVMEDDAAATETITDGEIVSFLGGNGITTAATAGPTAMTFSLPTSINDETGLYYDLTTAEWKVTEKLTGGAYTCRLQLDTEGNLPSGYSGDCGFLANADGGFSYANNFLISNGASGVANIWLSGNGANGSNNIYFSNASVAGDYPLPATYNQITGTGLATSAQAIVLSTGIGTGRPTNSGTEVALFEGNNLQIGSARTTSTGGKNLNDTSKYGGAQNNTIGGLLTFSNSGGTGSGSGYIGGLQHTTASSSGTNTTSADWYLGTASTTGASIDNHSCFRVYRATLSYQNSTDGVYQTETITIVSDLTTATWSVSDFLSTGAAASEIAWDVDFPTPLGSSLTYMRLRAWSTLVAKNVQFDMSAQCIGGNLI